MANLDDPRLMARLPIIDPDNPFMPKVMGVQPLPRDHSCRRCNLGATSKPACLEGYGPRGSTLLVLGSPTEADGGAGKWLTTGYNALVEYAVKKHLKEWRSCWAVSCPAGREPSTVQVDACRPYLMQELAYQPPRVLAFGPVAAEGLTGFPVRGESIRRCRARVHGVPVFFVLHPQKATHNRHFKTWLDEDVAWALTTKIEPEVAGEVRVLLTVEEAAAWLDAVVPNKLLALDTEYWPKSVWSKEDFRVLCMSFCQEVGAPVTIPGEVLYKVVPQLKRVCEDPRIPKVCQDVKNEVHVLWRAFQVELAGVEWDTLKVAGIAESEAPKGLGTLSWLVGMGGYKQMGQMGAEDDDE
jgi:uracil-DNA glycosylase